MAHQPQDWSPEDDLDSTAEIEVLDVAAYESRLAAGRGTAELPRSPATRSTNDSRSMRAAAARTTDALRACDRAEPMRNSTPVSRPEGVGPNHGAVQSHRAATEIDPAVGALLESLERDADPVRASRGVAASTAHRGVPGAGRQFPAHDGVLVASGADFQSMRRLLLKLVRTRVVRDQERSEFDRERDALKRRLASLDAVLASLERRVQSLESHGMLRRLSRWLVRSKALLARRKTAATSTVSGKVDCFRDK